MWFWSHFPLTVFCSLLRFAKYHFVSFRFAKYRKPTNSSDLAHVLFWELLSSVRKDKTHLRVHVSSFRPWEMIPEPFNSAISPRQSAKWAGRGRHIGWVGCRGARAIPLWRHIGDVDSAAQMQCWLVWRHSSKFGDENIESEIETYWEASNPDVLADWITRPCFLSVPRVEKCSHAEWYGKYPSIQFRFERIISAQNLTKWYSTFSRFYLANWMLLRENYKQNPLRVYQRQILHQRSSSWGVFSTVPSSRNLNVYDAVCCRTICSRLLLYVMDNDNRFSLCKNLVAVSPHSERPWLIPPISRTSLQFEGTVALHLLQPAILLGTVIQATNLWCTYVCTAC